GRSRKRRGRRRLREARRVAGALPWPGLDRRDRGCGANAFHRHAVEHDAVVGVDRAREVAQHLEVRRVVLLDEELTADALALDRAAVQVLEAILRALELGPQDAVADELRSL